jgi:AAA domain-containing protein
LRVVILCGLPGVGKLTIAQELGRTYGYRVFHNHLVFDAVEALFPFGTTAFIELRERLWTELLCRAVRERVGDVIFTIARDGAVDAAFLVRLREALTQAGAQVRCIELRCSEPELERRVSSPERSRFGKIHSGEAFRQLREAAAFPLFSMPPGTATIDTTDLSASQAAVMVAGAIDRAATAP